MRIVLLLMLLFVTSCIAAASANNTSGGMDNSPTARAKRDKMCVERCNKQHYPDVIVIDRGWVSVKKIHIILEQRTVCVCHFGANK